MASLMKQKWIDAFMDTAERFAQLSSAVRLKVGSVVVKDNRIISIGYNGTPAGWDNCCEEIIEVHEDGGTVTKTKDEVIHAEANAIGKLARDGESGLHASLFCTHAPCVQCAKMIYGSGIHKVYYRNSYRDTSGIEFLEKCGIEVEKTNERS
jgi:dCMP deaminase